MVLGIIWMIAPSNIFSTDPGKIFDFSGKRTADIFNKVVAKRANELEEMAFIEEGAQRRQQQCDHSIHVRSPQVNLGSIPASGPTRRSPGAAAAQFS